MRSEKANNSGDGQVDVAGSTSRRRPSGADTQAMRQPADVASPPLLDYAAGATYLGITASFLRRLVLEKRIRYYKVGKFVRFKVEDLDDFVDGGRVDPQDLRLDGPSPRRSPRRHSA